MRYIIIFLLFVKIVFAGDFLITETLPDNSEYISYLKNFEMREVIKPQIDNKLKAKEQEDSFILSGIFEINNIYYAIVNNDIFKKGDKVNSFKIIDIDLNSVTFLINGKKVVKHVQTY